MGKYNYSDEELEMNKVLKMNQDTSNELLNDSSMNELRNRADNAIDSSLELLKSLGYEKEVKKLKNDIKEKDGKYPYEHKPVLRQWDEIAKEAEDIYPDLIELEDILSEEELAQVEAEYDKINDEFKKITKLNKVDVVFVIIATFLQVIRQLIQPHLAATSIGYDDYQNLNPSNRKGEKQTAKDAKKEFNDKNGEKFKSEKEKAENDITNGSRYYHAELADIANILKGVPYDTVKGTKKFGVDIGGTNHRVKTLGHDPWLGYFFGTCNILTNTMSLSKTNQFRTLHIRNNEAVAEGNMIKMIEKSYERFKESKATVVLAFLKQAYHIQSDKKSKNGINLPLLQLLCDSDLISGLCEMGIDYNGMQFLGKIAKQAAFAEFINFIITIAHRIYMADEECKANGKNKLTLDDVKEYHIFKKEEKLSEVRTRKVILISNGIATSTNILAVAGVSAVGAATENPELAKEAVKYIDLGGALVTISHLFKDVRFIAKIKKNYIESEISKQVQEQIDEVDRIYNEMSET